MQTFKKKPCMVFFQFSQIGQRNRHRQATSQALPIAKLLYLVAPSTLYFLSNDYSLTHVYPKALHHSEENAHFVELQVVKLMAFQ